MSCLFCKILAGEIPSKKVFEDDRTYAFRDIASLAEADAEDQELLGYLHLVAARIASSEGLSDGFRTVINTGNDGGQTVDHLHIHLLGGRSMHWPPG
jgi:histidine triad (HIT) family protein